MSWLTENLASKGYVVAAIHHRDPDYSARGQFVEPLMRRPLDIAFVAQQLMGSKNPALVAADRSRVALVGYSMGGYGVLTAAGASLDPEGGPALSVPGGAMKPFVRGAARAAEIKVPGVKAVVAIAPAGTGFNAWGTSGLADITAPILIIGGDRDRTVGFPNGIRPIFDQAKGSDRYLLVFQNGGHAIGMTGAPPTMRSALWDMDWFEDPVWRHDRIMATEQHMITAFLDRFVKGDASRAAYLDTDVVVSNTAVWPKDGPSTGYDVISPGGPGATWKGFHKNHSDGLELHHKAPGA
jgi:predicted dienelactone hydrolase